MKLALDYINEYNKKHWVVFIPRDKFLEQYGSKFVVYLYNEENLISHILLYVDELRAKNKTNEYIGKRVCKEFWDVWAAKFMLHQDIDFVHKEPIIKALWAEIYAEMILFLQSE